MINIFPFTDIEIEIRNILGLARANDKIRTTGTFCCINVFQAAWSQSLTAEEVASIAWPLEGLSGQPDVAMIQKALTTLVRNKTLRSRRECGETLYEIAF